MIKASEKAYLAGLFDGEGCIHINRWANTLKNGHRYSLLVQIKMCDGRLLHQLHKTWGGNLNLVKRSLDNPNHSDILVWRVECQKAQALLELILPYLRLKRKQAELAIAFQDKIPHKRNSLVPTEELAFREDCYSRMKELKKLERTYRLL